jgi:predicted metallo-beta-lactamase superfamily hydrolase
VISAQNDAHNVSCAVEPRDVLVLGATASPSDHELIRAHHFVRGSKWQEVMAELTEEQQWAVRFSEEARADMVAFAEESKAW